MIDIERHISPKDFAYFLNEINGVLCKYKLCRQLTFVKAGY